MEPYEVARVARTAAKEAVSEVNNKVDLAKKKIANQRRELRRLNAKIKLLQLQADLGELSLENGKSRWIMISETSPSGKQLFFCQVCGRVSQTPDKNCRTASDPYESLSCSKYPRNPKLPGDKVRMYDAVELIELGDTAAAVRILKKGHRWMDGTYQHKSIRLVADLISGITFVKDKDEAISAIRSACDQMMRGVLSPDELAEYLERYKNPIEVETKHGIANPKLFESIHAHAGRWSAIEFAKLGFWYLGDLWTTLAVEALDGNPDLKDTAVRLMKDQGLDLDYSNEDLVDTPEDWDKQVIVYLEKILTRVSGNSRFVVNNEITRVRKKGVVGVPAALFQSSAPMAIRMGWRAQKVIEELGDEYLGDVVMRGVDGGMGCYMSQIGFGPVSRREVIDELKRSCLDGDDAKVAAGMWKSAMDFHMRRGADELRRVICD